MKNCLDMLLPTITNIVNLSLSTGTMPETFKVAELVPALKKHDADHEQFSNFRPISNLVMVSKVIEKAVSVQLTDHVRTHHLEEWFQSAYRIHHSTETALVKVQNDILRAIDDNRSVLLLLLDLSAAFDTVDHSTLLLRLRTRFGVKGSAIAWFESSLASRKYYVQVEGYKSSLRSLDSGVPQGSVLGPLLYVLYTSPVADIIKSHDLQYHFYADDTQLYITFKTDSADDACLAKSRVEHCVEEIDRWMISNKLKLNDDKTELIVFSSKYRPRPCLSNVQIGSECIEQSNTVRNLGVLFDQTLSFGEHVSKLCKSSHYHLRNISKIRKYLDEDSTETLVHAFFSSKLDYCNALLIGLPKYQIDRLQSVLNTVARIITFTCKYDHITPVLVRLHWLPVSYRIRFKVLLLTYKALNDLSPEYLSELLNKPMHTRNLRSHSQHLLSVPKSRTVTYGDRAFSVCAPKLWNELLFQLRMSSNLQAFKSELKTILFKMAYL